MVRRKLIAVAFCAVSALAAGVVFLSSASRAESASGCCAAQAACCAPGAACCG
jgi:hypothetical protein